MKREIITCDNCGVEKKETNHWLMINTIVAEFQAMIWDAKECHLYKSACGEKCASEMFAQWMEKLLPKNNLAEGRP